MTCVVSSIEYLSREKGYCREMAELTYNTLNNTHLNQLREKLKLPCKRIKKPRTEDELG